jgi:diguanylate cyclase (GGDEF)-like protein
MEAELSSEPGVAEPESGDAWRRGADEASPASGRRSIDDLLEACGLSESGAPGLSSWTEFLGHARLLLARHGQERFLLERSLDASCRRVDSLGEELRLSTEQLTEDHRGLRAANSVLAATLESTADGILVVGVDGQISNLNHRFAEMWRIPEEILASRDDSAALSFVIGQLRDPAAFMAKVESLYHTPEAASQDILEFTDGRVFERRSLPQRLDGEIIGRVWSFRDVTAEWRLNHELQHRALHDALTGLANRAAFDDHLVQALRRQARTQHHLAVVVVDLDGFKHINDSLGHQSGDAVLVAVADRLRSQFRDLDTIARLGGDEFVLLVEDVGTPEDAARLGQRLLETLATPLDIGDRQVSVGASIGITVAGGSTAEPDRLLGQADTAMYRAKHSGRARYQLFEPSMHTQAVERLELEQALRKAVTHGELTAHYQPIVDARTGRVVSFEALARWNDPSRGLVPPDTFIPVAEETGLIHDIGRTILLAACHQAQSWHAHHPDLRPGIAVNVSGRQLLEPAFERTVGEVLAATGFDPRFLTLEITESTFTTDAPRVVATLEALRHRGIRIAIDDFGTGYSSLAALAGLPIDTIKIDKRFVDDLPHDDRGRGLAKAIIGIAQTLQLNSVAEGVEEPAQHHCLREMGCQQLQGYLFARALPAAETLTYLAQGADNRPALPARQVSR